MAVKGGQIIHAGNGVTIIDRVQTGGAGQVNISTEKINELGNYKSVATVRNTPDLTFSLESYDVSTEVEELITGQSVGDPGFAGFDLARARPADFASQFKAGQEAADPFRVVTSVAVPFLYLEQMSYRFGLRDNATQSASFRGDSIFFNPGATFVESTAGSGTPGQAIATAHPAYELAEGTPRRVLSVTAGSRRLNLGADYTETSGAETNGAAVATITLIDAVSVDDDIRIVYSSPDAVNYPQTVHPDTTVKPAAVKGRDIEIYLGGYDPLDVAGSQVNKLSSVQSANVDWRVTLDKDEEFGNYYAVGQDFDVPTVNGSLDFRPADPAALQALVRRVSNVSDVYAVVGTGTSTPLDLDIVIKHPDTGDVLKRLHVPDARFTPPSVQGRVQQKLNVTMNFESDEGTLLVFPA